MANKSAVANQERADRAWLAVRAQDPSERGDSVVELLANVRHLCDKEGWDFDDLDRMAQTLYREQR